MRTVSTFEELNALPVKSVILDRGGFAWQKHDGGNDPLWHAALNGAKRADSGYLIDRGDFTVLFDPEAEEKEMAKKYAESNAFSSSIDIRATMDRVRDRREEKARIVNRAKVEALREAARDLDPVIPDVNIYDEPLVGLTVSRCEVWLEERATEIERSE